MTVLNTGSTLLIGLIAPSFEGGTSSSLEDGSGSTAMFSGGSAPIRHSKNENGAVLDIADCDLSNATTPKKCLIGSLANIPIKSVFGLIAIMVLSIVRAKNNMKGGLKSKLINTVDRLPSLFAWPWVATKQVKVALSKECGPRVIDATELSKSPQGNKQLFKFTSVGNKCTLGIEKTKQSAFTTMIVELIFSDNSRVGTRLEFNLFRVEFEFENLEANAKEFDVEGRKTTTAEAWLLSSANGATCGGWRWTSIAPNPSEQRSRGKLSYVIGLRICGFRDVPIPVFLDGVVNRRNTTDES
uniref:MATH domain-containing protein n=1 Tax=Steinernema glaseri TaxID=37863 RepID=A0A1I8A737_9BILA